MSLTRDAILTADDLPVLKVSTPEWGGDVFVRTLTAAENEHCQKIAKSTDCDRVFLGRFAALVLCDEQGNRLFTDADGEALGGKSLLILGRIMEHAQRHNGLSDEEEKATEKNSETSQG